MDEDMGESMDTADVDVDIPDDIPDDIHDDIPEDIPDDIPEDIPDDVPEDIPEDIPDDVPEDIPEDIPDDVPEDIPEDIPEDVPDDIPDDFSEDVPADDSSDDLADALPEDIPEDTYSDEPEEMNDGASDGVPKDIPEDIPEDMDSGDAVDIPKNIPEDIPEDVPVDDAADDQGELPADDAADDQSELPADDAADDQGELPADDAADDQGELPADDAADEQGELPADDAADDQGELPADDAADEQGELPADGAADDQGELPADDAIDAQGEAPADGAADDQGELPADDAIDAQGEAPADDAADAQGEAPADDAADDHGDAPMDDESEGKEIGQCPKCGKPMDQCICTGDEGDDTQSIGQCPSCGLPIDQCTCNGGDAEDNSDAGDMPGQNTADTQEDAFQKLSDYMSEHNYGKDDFAEYSQDPEWQKLHAEAFPDYPIQEPGDDDKANSHIDSTPLTAAEAAEWNQLDADTSEISTENSSSDELSKESDVWTADDQQLYDNDFGAVNESVMDYNDPEYLESGKLKPNWGNDAVDAPEQTILPEGTRVIQYAHPNQSGSYFAPEGTDYDDLQLPDSADKRVLNVYEVQEGGLTVDKSEVAVQPWNETADGSSGTGAQQYKSTDTADSLVEQGKLKPVESRSDTPVDDAADGQGENQLVKGDHVKGVTDMQPSEMSDAIDKSPNNAFNSLSEYMSAHDYGPDDFSTYSQDPEWRALQREAFPDYELPPLTQENAFNQLSDYMNTHNYGPDDFATYSQDPTWRELQSAAFPDYELPPIKSAEYSVIVDTLEGANVAHRPIELASEQRSPDDIVRALGGGDMTEGSCSSLAFAYAGNKAGYNVLDFRDGESRAYFSDNDSIQAIAGLPGIDSKTVSGTNDIACARELMNGMEDGKDYYLATGLHASIVRRTGDRFEFLELQSATDNGWKSLDDSVLRNRFGCEENNQYEYPNFLIDVDSLGQSEDFRNILGYINTAESNQVKGVSGHVR